MCVRSCHERGSLAPNRSLHQARPQPAGGAQLRDLLEEVGVAVEEEREARQERVGIDAAADQLGHVGDAVGDGERQLLRGRGAGLADVVAGDRHRVPARHVGRAELDQVADQPHAGPLGDDPLPLGDVLLEDVGLERAGEVLAVEAALLGGGHEQRQRDGRGARDGHRDRDGVEVDAVVEAPEVVGGGGGHALAADLAGRHGVVRVVAHQRGHVERRRQPRLALGQQIAEALVRVLGRAEAREHAHRPQPRPVHLRVQAARVGVGARRRRVGRGAAVRPVDRRQRVPGHGAVGCLWRELRVHQLISRHSRWSRFPYPSDAKKLLNLQNPSYEGGVPVVCSCGE